MPPLTEEKIREIIKDELQELLSSDRYIFHKTIQILDGRNIQIGLSNGTKIGTATGQKLGFYNATPAAQPSSTDETSGFTDTGLGTEITERDTFTGNVGSTAYNVSDIIKHLKNLGLIAQ